MTKKIDPTLTKRLQELVAQLDAQGVWLIRGAKNAQLIYTLEDEIRAWRLRRGETPAVPVLHIADTGVLVIMRFPADGGEPGVQSL